MYHYGSQKISTTSSGISVTGSITSTASTGNGTFNLVDTQNVLNAGNKIAFFAANRSNANEEMAFIQPRLQSNSGGAGNVQEGYLDLGTTGKKRITINPNGDISFYEDTGTTQALFWDASAEKLGIGTTSPSANLHVSSTGDTILKITSADGNGAFLDLGDASDTDGGRIVYDSGSNLAFYTASTERARIDASGNLLVGTTSTTPAFGTGNGTAIRTGEMSHISRSGGTALALNRASSDGDIVSFRKNGTQVGSIGTASSELYIGSTTGNDAFLKFGYGAISPSTSAGANSDNYIDLGKTTSRFKDLHLSGTVKTGDGTAAAPAIQVGDNDTGLF